MKQTRKVLAMILCLTLILGLATSVFAAPGHEHTITINNGIAGYEYQAYQIFAGELGHDGVLSNISWGSGVNGAALEAELKALPTYAACKDVKEIAAELAKNGTMDDPDAIAFAEVVAKHLTTPTGTHNWDGHKYTITGLDDGYYFVKNTKVPEGGTDTTYTRYILEVVRDIAVAHKGDFPHVDKQIIDNGVKTETNEASIGDKVTYEITGTMPDNIQYYSTYYYVFTDTLSKGLTFDRTPTDPYYTPDTISVTVNGVNVTKYFHISNTAYDAVNGTTIYIGIQDLLALELLTDVDDTTPGNQTVGEITKDTKVVVTYTAELNANAEVGATGNPNTVYLEYDNNPNSDGDGATTPPPPNPDKPEPSEPVGKTPEQQTITYTTKLSVHKIDGAGAILEGAEFTLTGTGVETTIVTGGRYTLVTAGTGTHYLLKDGKYTKTAPVYDDSSTPDVDEGTDHLYASGNDYILETFEEIIETDKDVTVRAFVDSKGEVIFTGLGAGTYTLTETVTPTGFNTIAPITFTIKFDAETKKFSAPDNNWILDSVMFPNTLYAEVVNVAGTTLPSTGGIGTTLFYVFGGLMFVGAAVLLVTKKRMAA